MLRGFGKLEPARCGTLGWCRGAELNCLRRPFQGRALPVSYLGTQTIRDFTENTRRSKGKSGVTFYFMDSSNSRIQSFFFSTSRARDPSGGPTMPSFSIRSMSRAARP